MTPPPLPPEPAALLASSWQRCENGGMSPQQALPDHLTSRDQLDAKLEANARLLCFAQPIIENLYQQIASSSSLILLSDNEGYVLRTVGDPGFVGRAAQVALTPGANWCENLMGTNAIGTALFEERTVAIHGDAHFLERNRFLSCLATPILAPTGGILGILDLSSDVRAKQPFARALLTTTAELIEHRLLDHLEGAYLSLHFCHHPELVGSPLEALLQFCEEGRVLAGNRAAKRILGDDAVRPGTPFDHIFNSPWALARQLALARERPTVQLLSTAGSVLAARFEQRRPVSTPPRPAAAVQAARDAFGEMNHSDPQMAAAIDRARRIAGHAIPLLIQGETGVGKEFFARAFHLSGPRRQRPWVAVNCAAIPANLIESELFGHTPGAFTGARGARGKLLEADGGTLFLDEIGDMPLALQAVLLRVLESRRVTPLGSSEEIPLDISLVCASHRSLAQRVSAGLFRADLLFRLNGLTVWLPPLRERSDFDSIARHMLAEENHGQPVALTAQALALLRRQDWPGNLRQLRNILRVSLALLDPGASLLTPECLPADLLDTAGEATTAPKPSSGNLRSAENRLVRECVARHQGNLSAAARELGITRTTLYRKLRA